MINVTVTVKSSLKVIRVGDFVCWDSGGLLFTSIQKTCIYYVYKK